eukprot:CAMPEP_0175887116 /NCGR_PEP_ID=MMETSP0107_2-20121207/45994_1 /TAXON_ID=195067 ORGANISM="Goniomonas pacifica, Strain CCMP1869" /NCGR_SAMPLE_ID=MMETSP0107_2 /ASSEMBLY_ACC=CAM_ASM_000203 /LENGTH=86 /DNA_ID=CAMNT_0017207535 /DNA_START=95 /DNA_END=355 /DNA_ORIENTATION=+
MNALVVNVAELQSAGETRRVVCLLYGVVRQWGGNPEARSPKGDQDRAGGNGEGSEIEPSEELPCDGRPPKCEPALTPERELDELEV